MGVGFNMRPVILRPLLVQEEAEGNASQSSPSSPGTPGSPGDAARAGFKPPAAAAAAADPSQSENSGSAADQPAVPSRSSGVQPQKHAAPAARARRAQSGRTAPALPKEVVGTGPQEVTGAGLISGSGASAPAAVDTGAQQQPSIPKLPVVEPAAGGPETGTSPPQTGTTGPASKQTAAVRGGQSGTTEAPLKKSGAGQDVVERGKAAKKRRRTLGPDSGSGTKRQREPDHAAVTRARGKSVLATKVLSAEQEDAASAPVDGGAKLDLLAAAAHQVYSWPRRRSSLDGAPGRVAAAAADEPPPTGPTAGKRPKSPLIKWPAAAAAMPDKRGSALSFPCVMEADWKSSTIAGAAGQQPRMHKAAQPDADGSLEPAAATTPARSTPTHGKSLRDRSASIRKSSKPWWVV